MIFALKAGEADRRQTAILGSILVNALLVLGLVIVVGARARRTAHALQPERLPNDTATLLQVTVFIIVLIGLIARRARPRQPSRPDDLRSSAPC